jgi:hypothetical protein
MLMPELPGPIPILSNNPILIEQKKPQKKI